MSFGQRLRSLRRDLDLSQAELADSSACSVNTVRKLESDERRPSRELATRLAEVFELPARDRADFLRLARGTQSVGRPSLPAPLTRLIGREQDLTRIRGLVLGGDVRLLSLVGPPGVGKTRLALQVATQLQEVFRDGAALVALAEVRDPGLVEESIAQTLGVRGTAARSLGPAVAEHLSGRHLLLVLDNFEQVLSARAGVPRLLAAAPRLTVLVTSRAALAVYGEQVYSVAPLGLPDAATRSGLRSPAETLFLDRARAVRATFATAAEDQRVVADICVRLDGLPLALELAATRARTLNPRTLLDQLGQRLDLLAAGPTDVTPRQRSMRGALDWSYELLEDDARVVFERLAVFAGGATLDAAAAVCADRERSAEVVKGVVADLVDMSLLRVSEAAGSTRFEMLETIREYALERLAAAPDESGVRRRHAEFFAALAEQALDYLRGPEQLTWLQRLEAEHANLRAALEWVLPNGAGELAGRLCAALWPFWRSRGHFHEGRRWLSATLALGARVPLATQAGVLTGAGALAVMQNDYAVATELLSQARELFRWPGGGVADKPGLALVLRYLGWVAHECGDYEQAESLCSDSLAIWREVGDAWGEAWSLNNLGMLALERGEPAQARELFAHAADTFRRSGDGIGSLQALTNLGWATQELGDYAGATALFAESLSLGQRLEDARSVANNLSNLALMAVYRADYPKASDLFADSLAAFSDLGDRRGVAESLEGLAGVAGVQGRPAQAARLFGAAEALREEIGAPLLPHDRSRYATTLAAAQEQLDEKAWKEAWAQGRVSGVEG